MRILSERNQILWVNSIAIRRPGLNTHDVKRLVGIPIMRDKALHLLDESIDAFRSRDAQKARAVQPADDEVDGLYDQIFRECVTYMIEDPRTITQCTQYILVARHLERVGDNAGKIAEKTIYMATGERRMDVA